MVLECRCGWSCSNNILEIFSENKSLMLVWLEEALFTNNLRGLKRLTDLSYRNTTRRDGQASYGSSISVKAEGGAGVNSNFKQHAS